MNKAYRYFRFILRILFRIQCQLASAVVKKNVGFHLDNLIRVGGLDISFVPNSNTLACVALVVMNFPIPTIKNLDREVGNIF